MLAILIWMGIGNHAWNIRRPAACRSVNWPRAHPLKERLPSMSLGLLSALTLVPQLLQDQWQWNCLPRYRCTSRPSIYYLGPAMVIVSLLPEDRKRKSSHETQTGGTSRKILFSLLQSFGPVRRVRKYGLCLFLFYPAVSFRASELFWYPVLDT